MDIPEKWRSYNCSDYFLSPFSESGWWDSEGQCWYIEPAGRIYEDEARAFLILGRPGVDGIEWGYRKGYQGIWAYYPIDNDFVFLSNSVSELREGYLSGRITV